MKDGRLNSDEALIAAIKSGDRVALKQVYQTHWPMVRTLVCNNSGSEDDAKDVFQEAIMVLHRNICETEFELTSKLKTYIYAVARRLWLKQLSRNSRYTGNVNDNERFQELEAETDAEEKTAEMKVVIRKSMKELGEPCQTILTDFFYGGLTMEEIAEKMGYTNAANAKNQKYKCFKRFKKIVIANNKQKS